MSANSRIKSLLSAWTNRAQELEEALWATLSTMTVDSAVGDLLDKIGALVGEARNGRVDTDYRGAVRIRIRANRSQGKAVDILDIATLAAVTNATTPLYLEYPPAGWQVEIPNLSGALSVVNILARARPVATTGMVVWTTSVLPGLVMDSLTASAVASPGKLDSFTGGAVAAPGYLAAGLAV